MNLRKRMNCFFTGGPAGADRSVNGDHVDLCGGRRKEGSGWRRRQRGVARCVGNIG